MTGASLKSCYRFFIWLHEFFDNGKVLPRLPSVNMEGMKGFWPGDCLKEGLIGRVEGETVNILVILLLEIMRAIL